MSNTITNLTGTTWTFNSLKANSSLGVINFEATIDSPSTVNPNFYGIKTYSDYSVQFYWDRKNSGSRKWEVVRFYLLGTVTITIDSITDSASQTLLPWLQSIATQQFSTTTYNIITTLTNLTASGDSTIDSDGTATVTLSANSGYTLPSLITVTNAQYTYDSSTGVISLSNATGDVTISANGVKIIISSFNELEVIDHTDYITLRVQDATINVAKQGGS